MSGEAEVIQEYLVKLGYKLDTVSTRKFNQALDESEKKVFSLGKGTAAAVAAVAAASVAFAYSMRKAYFSAELAGSSVKTMNSIGFAAKQVGIDSDAAKNAVLSLARAIRTQPGSRAYIESLTGMSTAGRDTIDVMNDLVRATGKYGESVGSQMMSPYMDADTYHMWLTHGDEMSAAMKKANKMFDQSGIDQTQLEKDVLKVAGAYDTLAERAELSAKRILAAFQKPIIKTFDVLGDMVEFYARKAEGKGPFFEEGSRWDIWTGGPERRAREAARQGAGTIRQRHLDPNAPPAKLPANMRGKNLLTPEELAKLPPELRANAGQDNIGIARAIAAQYGLDPDLFVKQMQVESGSGINPRAVGPLTKGGWRAMGAGQLSPANLKHYGVTDPFDLTQNLTASAKMMQELLQANGGDYQKSLADYNWGPDNRKKLGMSNMPDETRNYLAKILGGSTYLGTNGAGGSVVNMQTTITVPGASNPTATAVAVGNEQKNVAKDVLRNLRGPEGG